MCQFLAILVSATLVFIVRTNRQKDTHTHTHTQTTDAAKRFTPATVVGVNKDSIEQR